MLSLDSPNWSRLEHAYGDASNVPALLGHLYAFPSEEEHTNEPWFTLWSALLHQGDVYSASYAAVPHIVEALASAPSRATMSFFLLPAGIEVARTRSGESIAEPYLGPYQAALARLPALSAAAFNPNWCYVMSASALAASAVGYGNIAVAELLIEIEEGEVSEAIDWLKESR